MTAIKVLLILALAGAQQDQNEEFLTAARKGDVAAVKALLAKGVNVNAKTRYGATALSYACDRGNVEMVKLLLDSGADVNAKDTFYGEVPIGWAAAAQRGNTDMARVVLEIGGVKQDVMNSALGRALANNFNEIAEMLKKAGAQPPPPATFQIDADTLKSYAGVFKHHLHLPGRQAGRPGWRPTAIQRRRNR
jgi:ankyrin repeat protein